MPNPVEHAKQVDHLNRLHGRRAAGVHEETGHTLTAEELADVDFDIAHIHRAVHEWA